MGLDQAQLKAAFDGTFRFAIGDHVVQRLDFARAQFDKEQGISRRLWESHPVPFGVIVTGRMLEECHGGIQGYYLVRSGDHYVRIAEFELEPWDDLAKLVRKDAPQLDDAE